MKTFIEAFREFKSNQSLSSKLVWNPETNRWLTTIFFSNEYIKIRGMEVVHGG